MAKISIGMSRAPTVFTGEKYNRLTVISENGKARGRDRAYLCKCDCGSTVTVAGYLLKSGNTKSCGCLKRELTSNRMKTHGHTTDTGERSPTYESWRGMVNRCKPSYAGREWYAARGIKVHPRWRGREGFANFLSDMGERPAGLTLDRIDPNGNYELGNCRWATTKEQGYNRRTRARLSEVEQLEAIIAAQREEIARLRSR